MTEFTHGIFSASKNIYENNKGSILRTIIYTIGHFAIAITVLILIADVSFAVALTDAIVEPLANAVWYFVLDKIWTAKYKKSSRTEHIMPAEISKIKYNEVLRISQKAYKILKCKGIARCDFRFYKNKFFLLEVNTQPGMTSLSLVPEIAAYKNISFTKLVKWMVNNASLNR